MRRSSSLASWGMSVIFVAALTVSAFPQSPGSTSRRSGKTRTQTRHTGEPTIPGPGGNPGRTSAKTSSTQSSTRSQNSSSQAREVEIQVDSFIPYNYVTAVSSFQGTCITQNGTVRTLLLNGNNRGPGEIDSPEFKTRVILTLYIDPNDPNWVGYSSRPLRLIGPTREYADDALQTGGRLGPEDDDDVLDDCHLLHKRGQEDNDGLVVTAGRLSDRKVRVDIKVEASIPTIQYAPPINEQYSIIIDNTDPRSPTYLITGTHDCFPAHEIYINRALVHSFFPLDVRSSNLLEPEILACLTGLGSQQVLKRGAVP